VGEKNWKGSEKMRVTLLRKEDRGGNGRKRGRKGEERGGLFAEAMSNCFLRAW